MIALAACIACCAGSFALGCFVGGVLVWREMRRFNEQLQREADALERERDDWQSAAENRRLLRVVPRGPYAG